MSRPREHAKNITEIALVILFLVGTVVFLWLFKFSDQENNPFTSFREAEKSVLEAETDALNYFIGEIVSIDDGVITASPITPSDSAIEFKKLFPDQVRILVTPNTQFTVVEIEDEEAVANAKALYKKQIEALPPEASPADYPSYPEVVRSINLSIDDFSTGNIISVKSTEDIAGLDEFEASFITK